MKQVAATFSRGSVNYDIDIESSDKDYTQFYIPTLSDFTWGSVSKTKHIQTDTEDFQLVDIRNLKHMLHKTNFDGIQFLWSTHTHYEESTIGQAFWSARKEMFYVLYANRFRLAASTLGEYHKTIKSHNKKPLSTTEDFQKYNKFLINMFIKLDGVLELHKQTGHTVDTFTSYMQGIVTDPRKTSQNMIKSDGYIHPTLRAIRYQSGVNSDLEHTVHNLAQELIALMDNKELKPLKDEDFNSLWKPIDHIFSETLINYYHAQLKKGDNTLDEE